MPQLQDFSWNIKDDGVLVFSLAPQANLGGRSVIFQTQHRFGGISGLITKSAASGFGGGQSGITITNSGAGQLNITMNSADTSGFDPINYSYSIRTNDFPQTNMLEGYMLLGL